MFRSVAAVVALFFLASSHALDLTAPDVVKTSFPFELAQDIIRPDTQTDAHAKLLSQRQRLPHIAEAQLMIAAYSQNILNDYQTLKNFVFELPRQDAPIQVKWREATDRFACILCKNIPREKVALHHAKQTIVSDKNRFLTLLDILASEKRMNIISYGGSSANDSSMLRQALDSTDLSIVDVLKRMRLPNTTNDAPRTFSANGIPGTYEILRYLTLSDLQRAVGQDRDFMLNILANPQNRSAIQHDDMKSYILDLFSQTPGAASSASAGAGGGSSSDLVVPNGNSPFHRALELGSEMAVAYINTRRDEAFANVLSVNQQGQSTLVRLAELVNVWLKDPLSIKSRDVDQIISFYHQIATTDDVLVKPVQQEIVRQIPQFNAILAATINKFHVRLSDTLARFCLLDNQPFNQAIQELVPCIHRHSLQQLLLDWSQEEVLCKCRGIDGDSMFALLDGQIDSQQYLHLARKLLALSRSKNMPAGFITAWEILIRLHETPQYTISHDVFKTVLNTAVPHQMFASYTQASWVRSFLYHVVDTCITVRNIQPLFELEKALAQQTDRQESLFRSSHFNCYLFSLAKHALNTPESIRQIVTPDILRSHMSTLTGITLGMALPEMVISALPQLPVGMYEQFCKNFCNHIAFMNTEYRGMISTGNFIERRYEDWRAHTRLLMSLLPPQLKEMVAGYMISNWRQEGYLFTVGLSLVDAANITHELTEQSPYYLSLTRAFNDIDAIADYKKVITVVHLAKNRQQAEWLVHSLRHWRDKLLDATRLKNGPTNTKTRFERLERVCQAILDRQLRNPQPALVWAPLCIDSIASLFAFVNTIERDPQHYGLDDANFEYMKDTFRNLFVRYLSFDAVAGGGFGCYAHKIACFMAKSIMDYGVSCNHMVESMQEIFELLPSHFKKLSATDATDAPPMRFEVFMGCILSYPDKNYLSPAVLAAFKKRLFAIQPDLFKDCVWAVIYTFMTPQNIQALMANISLEHEQVLQVVNHPRRGRLLLGMVPNPTTIPQLVALGFSLEARGTHQQTALMQACQIGNIPVIQGLLAAGAHQLSLDDAGNTAAYHAAVLSSTPMLNRVRILSFFSTECLNYQAGPERKTVLMEVVMGNLSQAEKMVLVQALVAQGVRVDLETIYGQTAVDMAYTLGLEQLATLLRGHLYADPDFIDRGQALEMLQPQIGKYSQQAPEVEHIQLQLQRLFPNPYSKVRKQRIEQILQASEQGASSALGATNALPTDRIIDASGRGDFMTYQSYVNLRLTNSLHQYLRQSLSTIAELPPMVEIENFAQYLEQIVLQRPNRTESSLELDDIPSVDPITQDSLTCSIPHMHDLLTSIGTRNEAWRCLHEGLSNPERFIEMLENITGVDQSEKEEWVSLYHQGKVSLQMVHAVAQKLEPSRKRARQ